MVRKQKQKNIQLARKIKKQNLPLESDLDEKITMYAITFLLDKSENIKSFLNSGTFAATETPGNIDANMMCL